MRPQSLFLFAFHPLESPTDLRPSPSPERFRALRVGPAASGLLATLMFVCMSVSLAVAETVTITGAPGESGITGETGTPGLPGTSGLDAETTTAIADALDENNTATARGGRGGAGGWGGDAVAFSGAD